MKRNRHPVAKMIAAAVCIPLLLIVFMACLPATTLGRIVSVIASAGTGKTVEVERAVLTVFSRSPSMMLNDTSIRDSQDIDSIATVKTASATGRWGSLWRSESFLTKVVLDDADANLRVDSSGRPNWSPRDEYPEADQRSTTPHWSRWLLTLPVIELSNVNVDYQDAITGRSLTAMINAKTDKTDSHQLLSSEAIARIDGIPVEFELNIKAPFANDGDTVQLNVIAQSENSQATIEGTVDDLQNLHEIDLDFDLRADSLEDMAALSNVPMPVLPPLVMQGNVLREEDEIVLRRFDSTVGDSTFEGDIRIDPTTPIPTLYANIISKVFDLDDLAGLIGAQPDPDETNAIATDIAGTHSDNDSGVNTSERNATLGGAIEDSRLLPAKDIPAASFMRHFIGAIDFEAKEVRSPVYPIDAIKMRVEMAENTALIKPLLWKVANGLIEGSADLDLSDDTLQATVDLSVKHLNLREIMAKFGLDNDGFGQIGGQVKLWMQGDSLAELAGSADGGLFLIMTQGRISALLTELAGLDLAEALAIFATDQEDTTEISCAYADLHTRAGILTVETMVADTRDSVFLANGNVNLKTEALNLVFEPHPKDLSLLAAQTSFNINGTMKSPEVSSGDKLIQRAAAAAILAAIATPVAALIPFIEPGDGQDNPYCDGLVSSLKQKP